jgi:hypothetical protein
VLCCPVLCCPVPCRAVPLFLSQALPPSSGFFLSGFFLSLSHTFCWGLRGYLPTGPIRLELLYDEGTISGMRAARVLLPFDDDDDDDEEGSGVQNVQTYARCLDSAAESHDPGDPAGRPAGRRRVFRGFRPCLARRPLRRAAIGNVFTDRRCSAGTRAPGSYFDRYEPTGQAGEKTRVPRALLR